MEPEAREGKMSTALAADLDAKFAGSSVCLRPINLCYDANGHNGESR